MNTSITILIDSIKKSVSIPDPDKAEMLAVLSELGKLVHKLEFKVERLNDVKDTLSVMLEESVAELESKSEAVKRMNEKLSRTLTELQQYSTEVEKQKKQVEIEKSKSDRLLMDILPQQILEELKSFGRSYARKYDSVSVLFADIQGFSSIAEHVQPADLVAHLDDYFRGFDHIIEKYGMEKIKTIGDAYMCVSGLFRNQEDHAKTAVEAAMDMQRFIASFEESKKILGLPSFQFRIGIHSGPIVAGVIGIKKFSFDIWGDTVNMAARMEQHGEAGKINVSAATQGLVSQFFNCSPRGELTLKNGRQMEMFFVTSG